MPDTEKRRLCMRGEIRNRLREKGCNRPSVFSKKRRPVKSVVVRIPVGAANSRPRAHTMRPYNVFSYLNALLKGRRFYVV